MVRESEPQEEPRAAGPSAATAAVQHAVDPGVWGWKVRYGIWRASLQSPWNRRLHWLAAVLQWVGWLIIAVAVPLRWGDQEADFGVWDLGKLVVWCLSFIYFRLELVLGGLQLHLLYNAWVFASYVLSRLDPLRAGMLGVVIVATASSVQAIGRRMERDTGALVARARNNHGVPNPLHVGLIPFYVFVDVILCIFPYRPALKNQLEFFTGRELAHRDLLRKGVKLTSSSSKKDN